MNVIHYIGLDVHKKTISYCIKTAAGQIVKEGTMAAERSVLRRWAERQQQPWDISGTDSSTPSEMLSIISAGPQNGASVNTSPARCTLPGTYFREWRFGLDPDHPGCLLPLECHRLTIGQAPDGGEPSRIPVPCSPVDRH
jgi:hypothetical protein